MEARNGLPQQGFAWILERVGEGCQATGDERTVHRDGGCAPIVETDLSTRFRTADEHTGTVRGTVPEHGHGVLRRVDDGSGSVGIADGRTDGHPKPTHPLAPLERVIHPVDGRQ